MYGFKSCACKGLLKKCYGSEEENLTEGLSAGVGPIYIALLQHTRLLLRVS